MDKRRKVAIGGVAALLLVGFALFLNSRLSAAGIPTGGWHYDQLLVYTKMSKANQNTNPVLRDLYIFDTANNTEKKLPGILTGAVGKIAYSPATKILAYSNFKLKSDNTPNYNSCTLEIYDVSKLKKLPNLGPTINEPSGCSAPFSWSPDGSVMIFKHIIDYDYGNFVPRYVILNNSLLGKKKISIKKVGFLSPDRYRDINVESALGWYAPQAFSTFERDPHLVKVTFPSPRYDPVIKIIPGTYEMFGKVVFDKSFKKDLLYSLSPQNFGSSGIQVTTVPFAGGTPKVVTNTKYVADYILMRYGVDQSGGMIKELVYRHFKSLTDPENGFYTIDPNTGTRTLVVNTFATPITDFLSFDSGPGNRFYYRYTFRNGNDPVTSRYIRQTTNGNGFSYVVDGLSEVEL
ncbi:MAG: hypothetical protein AAB669_02740 [Patescibacteria group bacterium]